MLTLVTEINAHKTNNVMVHMWLSFFLEHGYYVALARLGLTV